jgi:hypothetical protein
MKAEAASHAVSHNEEERPHVLRLVARYPAIRERGTFGSPAFFLERRMLACVYGDEAGVKLPADRVATPIAAGKATPFRPSGKPAMREWLALSQQGKALDALADLFAEAVAFAKEKQ